MAAVEKFSTTAICNILRHNNRQIANPSNKDIDPLQSQKNYSLLNQPESSYDLFLSRKKDLYCYKRQDVKVLIGWVVTLPKNYPLKKQRVFFECVHQFLIERYGENNCVQSVVHNDESGQPHLHFCFIPAVPDKKHGGEKICANDVITRRELRNFHSDLQRYLNEHNIDANVMTGITKEQRGNKSVRELKRERDYQYSHERNRWL